MHVLDDSGNIARNKRQGAALCLPCKDSLRIPAVGYDG